MVVEKLNSLINPRQTGGVFSRIAPAACLGAALVLGACGAPESAPAAAPEAAGEAAPETAAVEMPAEDMAAPTLSRSTDVMASAADVWAVIGGFCAVGDWHPAVETCTSDDQTPPTRTLHIAGGDAIFVETETARDDAAYSYSYAIMSGPLPVSDYVGTLSVADNDMGGSTITWSSVYVAADGQDEAAAGALIGIYESGLAAIVAQMAG
jgi:hypothetical protein